MPGFGPCYADANCVNSIRSAMNQVRLGQSAIVNVSHLALQGVDTDDLLGDTYRYTGDGYGVHMNLNGLIAHAQRWRDVLVPFLRH
jgi:hypothetical protein